MNAGGIALFAFLLRIFHARNGLPYIHHWDEPYVAFRALDMVVNRDLNPYFFFYGSLLMYLNAAVDWLHSLYLKWLPDSSIFALNEANPLAYGGPTGFDWHITHPSFLFWDRVLTALFGALTVAIVYYLVLKLGNRFAAVVAALLLAGTMVHIEHSAYVTTDIPMGFFVWGAILFAYLFSENSKLRYLVLSLTLCGLATSIKYNAGLVIVVPALVLWFSRKRQNYRHWMWLLIPVVPASAFFVGSPYGLIEFSAFLDHFIYNFVIYSQSGPSWATIEPGLPHILYQGGIFLANIGVFAAIIALIGIVKLLRRNYFGWILLGYQLFYFLLITQMKISYHRNFLILYPLLAILFGLGIVFISDLMGKNRKWGKYAQAAFWLISSLIVVLFSWNSLKVSWRVWNTPESRTRAVMKANEMVLATPEALVGIATELKLHPYDLDLLEAAYTEAPLMDLMTNPEQFDLILAFAEVGSEDHDLRDMAGDINRLLWRIPEDQKMYIGSGVLNLRTFSVNPGVVIFPDPDALSEFIGVEQP